jgi:hypothetical protein
VDVLIPSGAQIADVREDLTERMDAGDAAVQELIQLCDRYVETG